jgi:predicted transcriptional regulator
LADGAFQQFSQFDARQLDVQQRRALEYELATRQRLTQAEIGQFLGVAQPTVSADLKLMRQRKIEA